MKAPSQRYKYFKNRFSKYGEPLSPISRLKITRQAIKQLFSKQPQCKTDVQTILKELSYFLAWLTPCIDKYCHNENREICHQLIQQLVFKLDHVALSSMLIKRGEDLTKFNHQRLNPCFKNVLETLNNLEEAINSPPSFDEVQ
jgi:hypothetical protein